VANGVAATRGGSTPADVPDVAAGGPAAERRFPPPTGLSHVA